MTRKIQLPLTDDIIADLQAGDRVLLSGVVLTARDAAHKRLVELLNLGLPLSIHLAEGEVRQVPCWEFFHGQLLYYVGPTPAPKGMPIGSAGPTTAERMDKYTPRLLAEIGVKGLLGKGWRTRQVREALVKHKAVYLAALTIAAVYAQENITASRIVAFADLGPEAVRELQLTDFPAVVINDVYGNDYYEALAAKKGIADPRLSRGYHGE